MQLRIEEETKIAAGEVFVRNGMTISEAIRHFMDTVARTGEMPDGLKMSAAQHAEWDRKRLERVMVNRGQSRPVRDFLADMEKKYGVDE